MSDENQVPSGDANQNPVDNDGGNPSNDNRTADSVKYETYKKVLSEKKKMQSDLEAARKELEDINAQRRAAEEQDLKEQNKWKEIAERKEQEAQQYASKIKQFEDREIASRKLDRVLNGVGQPIPQKYWGLIDLDSVEYDAETGSFDESSLNAEIQRIKEELPEIIAPRKDASHDPSAPQKPSHEGITPEKFASLPKDQKKAAVGQFKNAPAWMRGEF